MLPVHSRTRGGARTYTPAVALTVGFVTVMAAVTVMDVPLAARLVSEDGPVEWLQVILLAGTALIAARLAALEWAEGRSGAPELLLTAGFAILAFCEMELPRRILGKSTKISRLAREVAAGMPRETVFFLLAAGLAVGLGVYAFRYRADIVAWGWSARETTWGRLFLLGASLLVLTELFERSLNRMAGAGLPKPLLEESLELLAALYCFLAMMRRRTVSGSPSARPGGE
jgi:hypothetical protein